MKTLFSFFIVFIVVTETYTQSKTFHLGLKAEFYGYTLQHIEDTAYTKKFSFSPLPSMYAIITKDLSEAISLSLKPGILFRPELFQGYELGMNVDYKFPSNSFFLTGGINLHFVKEEAHGTGHYESTDSKTMFFLILGVGYRITEIMRIDIAYHQALNPEFGFVSYGYFPYASGPLKLTNMLKLGLSATL